MTLAVLFTQKSAKQRGLSIHVDDNQLRHLFCIPTKKTITPNQTKA
ncbi:hypothetical protein EDC51_11240 [Bibersteinia trehalosi]|nr:hypothetical protein EDC51_11240 [Bibersteinia trehalosi]